MMISMQYLKSRFFRFELQMLFTYNDGNFGKSGRLVQVAEIAPDLLSVGWINMYICIRLL